MDNRSFWRRSCVLVALSVLAILLTLFFQRQAAADPLEMPDPLPPEVKTEMAPTHEIPEPIVVTLGAVIEMPETVIEEPAPVNEADAEMLARVMWGEARGLPAMERAAVAWCVLNRVDAQGYGMGDTIAEVVTFQGQYAGYSPAFPVTDELYTLAVDVLTRWERERTGETDVGRVLPAEYLWFDGDGVTNTYRDAYIGGAVWGWTLPDPYEG